MQICDGNPATETQTRTWNKSQKKKPRTSLNPHRNTHMLMDAKKLLR